VALTARAFGADGIIIADVKDEAVESVVNKVVKNWGGEFKITSGVPWVQAIQDWKKNGGEVIHLTMYGVKVDEVIDEIRVSGQDKLVVVGAEKVPGRLYSLADYNVSIGNQPHSEVSALSVFLDRLFKGEELSLEFDGAKIRVEPCSFGKKLVRMR
jgi:tRNA (cytidine56-2'-O)-methyltransferase